MGDTIVKVAPSGGPEPIGRRAKVKRIGRMMGDDDSDRAVCEETGLGPVLNLFTEGKYRILKRKPATIEGRVWKCADGWFRCAIGTDSFLRHPKGRWAREAMLELGEVIRFVQATNAYTELFGPELDAIIAECRKATGI